MILHGQFAVLFGFGEKRRPSTKAVFLYHPKIIRADADNFGASNLPGGSVGRSSWPAEFVIPFRGAPYVRRPASACDCVGAGRAIKIDVIAANSTAGNRVLFSRAAAVPDFFTGILCLRSGRYGLELADIIRVRPDRYFA